MSTASDLARPAPIGVDFGSRGVLLLILLLAVYMPFEEFLLKWIPVSEPVYLLLRIIPELLIYLLLLLVLAARAFQSRNPGFNWIDLFICAFILVAFVSIILHGSSWTNALVNLRTLLRYVALFYVVCNLRIDRSAIRFVLTAIVVVAALQGLLALYGFLDPATYSRYFLPRETHVTIGDLEVGFDAQQLKSNALAGTLGRPAALALLMSTGLLVLLVGGRQSVGIRSGWIRFLLLLLMATGLFLSQKRGIILSGLAVCALLGLLAAGNRRLVVQGVLAGIFAVFLVATLAPVLNENNLPGPLAGFQDEKEGKRVSELFSPQYWEHSLRVSRGWFVTAVGGHLATSKWVMTGLSADEHHVRNYLIWQDSDFRRMDRFNAFKDVYWVAMFSFYGLIGVLLLWAVFWRLCRLAGRLSRFGTPDDRVLSFVLIGLIMIMFLTGFIERSPEIKVFSFYVWLIAGMLVSRLGSVEKQFITDEISDEVTNTCSQDESG